MQVECKFDANIQCKNDAQKDAETLQIRMQIRCKEEMDTEEKA